MKIEFTVPALPTAQPRQRHRIINAGGRAFAHNYTPTRDPVNAFKAAVQMAVEKAYQGPPLEGPLRMSIVFVCPRPKNMIWKTKPMPRVWHDYKFDRDNLMKSLQDAMNKIVFLDDSQICSGPIDKVIAAGDESAHVEVVIERLIDAPIYHGKTA